MTKDTVVTLLLAFLSISWSGWLLSFAIGKWTKRQETIVDAPIYRIEQLEKAVSQLGSSAMHEYRITMLENSMNRAGEKMSDLANEVQKMPEMLRKDFITRTECEMLVRGPRRHTDEKG